MFTSTLLAATLAATPAGPPEVPPTDVRENVKKGLKWLAGQQRADGSWTCNNNGLTAHTTAYAGLALLMEGSTLREGQYATNLRAALVWFEKVAQPNGLLVPADDPNELGRQMLSHTSALLFLASAYDPDDEQPRRARLRKLIEAAVRYAVDGQSPRGGWGYVPAGDGRNIDETGSTASMVQALRAAERAGIEVPRAALDKAARYLAEATNPKGGLVYTVGNGFDPRVADGQPLPTAAAAGAYLAAARRHPALAKWVEFALKHRTALPPDLKTRPDLNNSFYFAERLAVARLARGLGENGHRLLDPKLPEAELLRWSSFREPLFQYLRATQTEAGGWADSYVGPSFGTAVALITLQLDNDFLPAFGG